MEDLIIPFVILLALTIYLMVSRARFEQKLKLDLDKELQKYKSLQDQKEYENHNIKELKALVFEQNNKLIIEAFDKNTINKLQKSNYKIEFIDYQREQI
jgi:hypothetical protein